MPKEIEPSKENTLFRQQVESVTRLRQKNRVTGATHPETIPRPISQYADSPCRNISDSADHSGMLGRGDALRYAAPGIQERKLKKLRRRGFHPVEEIDLHGMTVEIARRELSAFIAECLSERIEAIKVIHGKGMRTVNRQPVLKNAMNTWLRQCNDVLAFCSAQPADGGTGAVYVLLRKSR